MESDIFLGTTLKFPIELENGYPVFINYKETIAQGIGMTLNTGFGERFLLPEYGSRLKELIFEQNDDILFEMIKLFTKNTIEKWEKRVKFINIEFLPEEEKIDCIVSVEILSLSELLTFIYPFYKK